MLKLQHEDVQGWEVYIPSSDSHGDALAELGAAVLRGELTIAILSRCDVQNVH